MARWVHHPELPEGPDRWQLEETAPQVPVTEKFTAATPLSILSAGGILRASEVVELAADAGLDLAAAATLLQKESGGGRNVWGHDGVATAGIYVKGAEVTREAYMAYKARRSELGSQGVGPCQLTYWSIQDKADALGGCWDWRNNVTVGFQLLAGYIRSKGLRDGFRQFNGSGPAAEAYANDAMGKYQVWRARLGSPAPVENGLSAQDSQKIEEIHEQLLGAYNAWGGGVTDDQNTPYVAMQYLLRANVEQRQMFLLLQQFRKEMLTPANRQLVREDINRLVAATRAANAEHVAQLTEDAGELETAGFWRSAAERALKSFAGAALTLFGAGPLNVLSIDWETTLGLSAGAAVVSLLMSITSAQVGTKGSPSLIRGGD